mgnify:CR=1 FL=1
MWLTGRAEVAGLRAERDGLRERIDEIAAVHDDDSRTAAALAPMGEVLQRVSRKVDELERMLRRRAPSIRRERASPS